MFWEVLIWSFGRKKTLFNSPLRLNSLKTRAAAKLAIAVIIGLFWMMFKIAGGSFGISRPTISQLTRITIRVELAFVMPSTGNNHLANSQTLK
ncbi:MAG: hypothetical protein DHS20C08_06850 [Rhodomicrobium sp.]|nr:MAG: hypothetical protein DHS20C08_06850 [Rhodomicrobium sp.]